MCTSFSPSEPKVYELVSRYREVHELHPLLADMFSSAEFEGVFHDALRHEQYIISRRSQDLADNEITFMQKAFVELLRDNTQYYAASALWVEEILGINVVPVENKPTVLNAMVNAKSMTLDRLQECQDGCNGTDTRPLSASKENSLISDGRQYQVTQHTENMNSDESTYETELQPLGNDTKFLRLMEVYKEARSEFDTTPPKSLDRTNAAKFLRDTIENCQSYLKTKYDASQVNAIASDTSHVEVPLDIETVTEMERFLKKASEIAEKGSGGKKRRFDKERNNEIAIPATYPEQSVRVTVSANAAATPREHREKNCLGRYSVVYQNGYGHPPQDTRTKRREPEQFNGFFKSSYRQRNSDRSTIIPYRGSAPSPSPQASRRSCSQLNSRGSRFGSMPYYNCYRPAYY